MCDDFQATYEWEVFAASMKSAYSPTAPSSYPNDDHDLPHHLRSREAVTRPLALNTCAGTDLRAGWVYKATWRGIYDDKGRLMVAICHNMDLARFLGVGR